MKRQPPPARPETYLDRRYADAVRELAAARRISRKFARMIADAAADLADLERAAEPRRACA